MGQEVEHIRGGLGSAHELSTQERSALETMRSNADTASKIVTGLLQVVETRGDKISSADLPGLLRAASDAQAKAIEGITKLTGRDQAPAQSDLATVLDSLAGKGLLRMSVEIGPTSTHE